MKMHNFIRILLLYHFFNKNKIIYIIAILWGLSKLKKRQKMKKIKQRKKDPTFWTCNPSFQKICLLELKLYFSRDKFHVKLIFWRHEIKKKKKLIFLNNFERILFGHLIPKMVLLSKKCLNLTHDKIKGLV